LECENKAAFVVFFIGDYARNMIKKFCDYMGVEIFLDSSEKFDSDNMVSEVEKKIRNHEDLLHHTDNDLKRLMEKKRGMVQRWGIQLKQELSIRSLLNKFGVNRDLLQAEGWIPTDSISKLERSLEESTRGTQGGYHLEEIAGKGTKPTYFRTNEFTAPFQNIIDTYGIARNGEFNPAVPSIITFPFLFGVMYGDVFHGSFLLLGALLLLWNEKSNAQSKNEMLGALHYGRYLFLLMGLFAVFNGFIYNDLTSISMNLWNGTQYEDATIAGHVVEKGMVKGVYAFGVDPVWGVSSQQLAFMNSLKMKTSVILGITQLSFGL